MPDRHSIGDLYVEPRSRVVIRYVASAAPSTLSGRVKIRHNDGTIQVYSAETSTFTTDRTQITITGDEIRQAGWIIGAGLGGSMASLKRGQFYARLLVEQVGGQFTHFLCQGYVYQNFALQLGMQIENRQRKVGKRTLSEYRYSPGPAQGELTL